MEDTPDLGLMIGYCAHLGMRYNEKRLRQSGHDVTPVQSRILMYLYHQDGHPVNQRDLERETHLKPSTVNGIVSRLEEKGCIIRQPSPSDGRVRLVRLTEAGRRKAEAFHTIVQGTGRRFARCLSEEEEASLRDMLSRIIETLEIEVNKA